jgi:hypothetical protein
MSQPERGPQVFWWGTTGEHDTGKAAAKLGAAEDVS